MKLPKELIDFLKGTDIGRNQREKPASLTSTATPKGLERYNDRPIIVQSGSGRRGEIVDRRVLDIQETDAFKRLPHAEQRRLLRTMVASSVRNDMQETDAQTDDVREEKRRAVETTRNQIGESGLKKLINRIRNL